MPPNSRIAKYAGKTGTLAVAGLGLISFVAVEAIARRGFDESARAALQVLEKRIDGLQEKALKGKLTQQEAALKANLDTVRTEMLTALDDLWEDRRSWLTRRHDAEE